MCDLHVPIRAGTDIAFLGGVIRHVLETESYFRDYVVHYTNAATIIGEDFRDTEELGGLFSGFDPQTGTYDRSSWMYEGGEVASAAGMREHGTQAFDKCTGVGLNEGAIRRDETLQDPRCVFQILRRHFARYTPAMVYEICGVSEEAFLEVADTLIANSGRDRTTALCYAVGWTQQSVGVQIIRTAAILQLLLGNIGRPGGGIMAMRGHASIQGSTDVPTLYDLLPGYLHMPHAAEEELTLAAYIASGGARRGWWAHFDRYIVSLLKAWFGDAATAENDFGFGHLPKITGDHAHFPTMMRAVDGGLEGMVVIGQNPAVGSQNGGLMRRALRNMKWLVVRDLAEIETATFWRDAPEIASGEVRTQDIRTEVFLMPAASHIEKEGTFTNTQRLLQWRDKALDAPGDARSELWFMHHLTKRVKAHYATSTAERDWAIRNLAWDYEEHGPERDLLSEDILREINGCYVATGAPVPGFDQLAGGRLDGLRLLDLLRRVRRRRQPGSPARARRHRRRGRLGVSGVGMGLAGQPAHALQPRLRRPRRQAVVGAQAVCLVGRGAGHVDGLRRPRLPGRQAPGLPGAGGWRHGHGRDRGGRPVHHDGRRPGVVVHPERTAGRAAAHALRADRVAGVQRAVSRGRREPGGDPLGAPRQSGQCLR